MKNLVEQFSKKFGEFTINHGEFGTNSAINKHTKISVKFSVKIRVSADIQKIQISADNISGTIFRSVSTFYSACT